MTTCGDPAGRRQLQPRHTQWQKIGWPGKKGQLKGTKGWHSSQACPHLELSLSKLPRYSHRHSHRGSHPCSHPRSLPRSRTSTLGGWSRP